MLTRLWMTATCLALAGMTAHATEQPPQRLLRPAPVQQPPATPQLQPQPQLQRPGIVPPGACTYTTYQVSRLAPAGGDGSMRRPFRQPVEAFAAGPARGDCGIRLEIQSGVYTGNLVVSVPTILHGAAYGKGRVVLGGNISNRSNSPLVVEQLTLRDSPAPGAVVVSHVQARTTLRDVTIERATGYGLRQTGGTLLADGVTIRETRSAPATSPPPAKVRPLQQLLRQRMSLLPDIHSGSAIFVGGGSHASLDHIALHGNRQGLVVAGRGTRLRASALTAIGQRGDPAQREHMCAAAIRNGFAAVEVRDGALAYLVDVQLDDNEVYGLSVHDGGRAHVERVSIQHTQAAAACAETHSGGGINASVRHGGAALEMVELDLGHARLAGVQVIDADASLRNGQVHDNPIGVHMSGLPEDFDFACLTRDVLYHDNGRNLDADRLPIPGSGLPGESHTSPCVRVDWP